MTSRQAKRRHSKRKAQCMAAWTVVFAAELLAAAIPTALFAAVAIPLARAERGYSAFGIEHIFVAAIFCAAYSAIHRWVCKKLFGEVKSR